MQDGAEGSSGKVTSRLPIELDTVESVDRLGIAGSLPAMAVRAVSGLVGLAGLGIGYGMAKLWKAQDSDCSLRQGARHLEGTYKGELLSYFLMFKVF